MVIRKIIAVFFQVLFVLFLTPLIIAQSVFMTVLNEAFVLNKIVPESYAPFIRIAAESFAKNADETDLYARRFQDVLPQEEYAELVRFPLQLIFEKAPDAWKGTSFVIDFADFKEQLKKTLPDIVRKLPACAPAESSPEEFRFCKPKGIPSDAEFARIATQLIDTRIPPRFEIKDPPRIQEINPDLARTGEVIAFLKANLVRILLITGSALLLIIALILIPHWNSMLTHVGAPLTALALFLGLFGLAVARFPLVLAKQNVLTPATRDFIAFVLNQPNAFIIQWALLIGITGGVLWGGGLLLGTKLNDKK